MGQRVIINTLSISNLGQPLLVGGIGFTVGPQALLPISGSQYWVMEANSSEPQPGSPVVFLNEATVKYLGIPNTAGQEVTASAEVFQEAQWVYEGQVNGSGYIRHVSDNPAISGYLQVIASDLVAIRAGPLPPNPDSTLQWSIESVE